MDPSPRCRGIAVGAAPIRASELNAALLQGIKLYYRVLESMMRDQEAKGGRASAAALLRSDAFHRALLALSFEMVVASYRMVCIKRLT